MLYQGQKCDVVTSVLLLYITVEECKNGSGVFNCFFQILYELRLGSYIKIAL